MGILKDSMNHISDHHAYKNDGGYITVFTKKPKNSQLHYTLEQLSDMEELPNDFTGEDVYFSMNDFYRPQRRIGTLKQLKSLYVDIDFYNVKDFKGMDLTNPRVIEWIKQKILLEYVDSGIIPNPNRIINSGRGLVFIWFIEPETYKELAKWQRVEDYLFESLKPVGGDPKAKDSTRIFRLAGTSNSKNGKTAFVESIHDYRYDLAEMMEEYLPTLPPTLPTKSEKKPKPTKRKRTSPGGIKYIFNEYTLAANRIRDLETIRDLRNGDMTGNREMACFIYRMLVYHFKSKRESVYDVLSFNSEFTEPLPKNELLSATQNIEKQYYKMTNNWIIKALEITEDEQKHLCTIISTEEKKRRNTESRRIKRKGGTMDEYTEKRQNAVESHLERLRGMVEKGMKKTEMAKELGLSRQHLYRLLGKL